MAPALPSLLERELAEYARRVRDRFGPRVRLVRLFGSWARGQATADSDIDLVTVIDDLTISEWREARLIGADVSVFPGPEPLSVLLLSGAQYDELVRDQRRMARDIEDHGIAL
jgi:predicted nucleotidyltransferase